MNLRAAWLALLLGLAACGACSREPQVSWDDAFPAEWPRPHYETATMKLGGEVLTVEVADTNERRRYGFMFVPEPPSDDRGMLFVYPEPLPLNFWMRNTRIDLDLIYLADDGRVLNVHRKMAPFDETSRHEAREACRYALEVRGGWCEDHGVWVGAMAEFSAALQAVSAEPQAVLDNIPRLLGPGDSN